MIIIYFVQLFFSVDSISLSTAAFHSISARTAGFSTLDLNQLNVASLWFIIILMFIGASPGSTGGGIKTTTFGVLLVALIATIRG